MNIESKGKNIVASIAVAGTPQNPVHTPKIISSVGDAGSYCLHNYSPLHTRSPSVKRYRY
ncbi:MAG: hypothetical protein ABIN67_21050 [Ferruginibacter sp.]